MTIGCVVATDAGPGGTDVPVCVGRRIKRDDVRPQSRYIRRRYPHPLAGSVCGSERVEDERNVVPAPSGRSDPSIDNQP
jgi:hypothetical protein